MLRFTACVALAGLLLAAPASAQSTFTVTNTNDIGAGSLRQALLDANADADASTIVFDIPGDGPRVIQSLSFLPPVTAPVTIDGFTQPGASPNTNALWGPSNADLRIVLDGTFALGANGLSIQAPNSTVRGLAVDGFDFHGIVFQDADGGRVEGCYVGTDVAGTGADGNGFSGVWLNNAQATIGGPDPEDRNVISGNGTFGVLVYGAGASGSVVQGSYVGTNPAGTAALGNGASGIFTGSNAVFDDPNPSEAQDVLIGGSGAGEGNLISGNGTRGIEVVGRSADGPVVSLGDTRVAGNRIGTDAGGAAAVGNNFPGVSLFFGVTGVTIGGDTEAAGNVVSGNDDDGIIVDGSEGIVVENNLVGTDAGGTEPLGNAQTGILGLCADETVVRANVAGANGTEGGQRVGAGVGVTCIGASGSGSRIVGNWIGTDRSGTADLGNGPATVGFGGVVVSREHSDATVGGTDPADANVIAFNNGAGVVVRSSIAGPVAVLGNRTYGNRELGIDLEPAGPTANDDGDGDDGANRLQNYPEIADFSVSGGEVTVTYSVDTDPSNAAFPLHVEFFRAGEGGEGEAFLGADEVTAAEAQQTLTATLTPAATLTASDDVVATATDADGNTSEFTRLGSVAAEPGAEVAGLALTASPNPASDALTLTLTLPEAGAATVEAFDALGRRVALLHDGPLAAGEHRLRLDAAALPAGLYVVRAAAGLAVVTRRVTLLR